MASASVTWLLDRCGEPFECGFHASPIVGCAISDPRDHGAALVRRFWAKILPVLGDATAFVGRVDGVTPLGEYEVTSDAIEEEALVVDQFDDGGRDCPFFVTVAVVAGEYGTNGWLGETFVPLCPHTLGAPFAHAGDVSDGSKYVGWRRSDVTGHFKIRSHVSSLDPGGRNNRR